MRIWKTTKGTYLIEKELTSVPFVSNGISLNSGKRFDDAAECHEVTESGRMVKKYDKLFHVIIEDQRTVSNIHWVIDGGLYKFHWSQCADRTELQFTLLLSGLQPTQVALPLRNSMVLQP